MIIFNEKSKVFTLHTQKSTYQFCVGKYGYLLHLYYGKKVENAEMTYLLTIRDRGFAAVPYENREKRDYSLDLLPQEFSAAGLGDYRTPCISVINSDGSCAADLRYVSHKIYSGREPLCGLPHAFGDNIETLEVVLCDGVSGAEVTLYYHVLEDTDTIVRSTKVKNISDKGFTLDRCLSTCVDFGGNDYDFVSFYGRHTMERCLDRAPLMHGTVSVGSTRGASSHQHNPFVILCDSNATEDFGDCYGLSFVYSGNFIAQAEVDQINQTRLVMGINPELFSYALNPGEEFVSPECAMCFSDGGFSQLSVKQHRFVNEHISRFSAKKRPVVINSWEAVYFDFNEEKLLEIAKDAAPLGIDMLVIDDGWFGKRDDDTTGLGDWFVNEKKLKGGLAPLCEKVKNLGMDIGIWYEPEMISEDSDLYRAHRDWCINVPTREGVSGRMQFVLDMSRSDVVDYLYGCMEKLLSQTNIRYVKWDFNRHINGVYSALLPKEKQGEVSHRYILGLYSLLERLITKFPDLLIEGCSGGGGRYDLGMMYYTPQIWCSDNTDAIARLQIQYGTSFAYPMSALSAHVSVCPNHQTGRITPIETRFAVALTGAFGYELDAGKLTDKEREDVKRQVKFYKAHEDLFKTGDYYRLTDPQKNRYYAAWQYVSRDKKTSLLEVVLLQAQCNADIINVKMKGIDSAKTYKIGDAEYSGSALINGGILIDNLKHDYQSVMIEISEIAK